MEDGPTLALPIVAIVEDDRDQARVLSMLLSDWGCEPICGSCASEIARTLGRRIIQIKAIIADFELDDGLTGLRNAESLRLAIGRKVPTIVTTGHRRQAEHEDKFAVLEKPFDPSVLHDWLISQVGSRVGTEEESSAH